MKSDTFEQAQRAVNRGLIESLFQAPGAYWKADEYWTLNPTRADNSVGSFHIFEHGGAWVWKDFSSGESGDVIGLLAASTGKEPLEAAKEIIERSGGTVPSSEPPRKKPPKSKAIIPIPETAARDLALLARASPIGKVVKGWRYYRAPGEWAFSVVRYETDTGKTIRPYQWTAEGWREGMPLSSGRPLYHLPELLAAPDAPVLVVEGEKCADVPVPGWVVVTWSSGASSVDNTDWSPLSERAREGRVTIWPDNDDPGMKAALAIARRLPGARILDVNAEGVA